jgi:CRP/FNR family transcriptional regulator
MTAIIAELLAKTPYFRNAPPSLIETMAAQAILREYSAGTVLFLEGEPASGLWIIEHGSVKITRMNTDGMEHVLRILGAGMTFNDIGALDGRGNPAGAAALSDVRLWVLPAETLRSAIEAHPVLALNTISALTARVRALINQVEDLTLYSVNARLARFLLKQAQDPALSGPGVTRAAIAAYLNTTPQTISTALRELESSGAIRFDRHHIYIEDEIQLRSIGMIE